MALSSASLRDAEEVPTMENWFSEKLVHLVLLRDTSSHVRGVHPLTSGK